jgi:hypothetical protein
MPGGTFATPRPAPSRSLPLLAGTAVFVVALPVFVIVGWDLGAWALAAAFWAIFQGIGFALARLPLGADNVGTSGVVAVGRMLRTIVLLTVLIVVTTRDSSLGFQAAILFGLAFSVEFALSMIAYLNGETKTG